MLSLNIKFNFEVPEQSPAKRDEAKGSYNIFMVVEISKIPGGKELIDVPNLLGKIGVTERMTIADLGCGRRGYFSLQVAKLVGPRGLVYAVDILQPSLKSLESMAHLFGINNIKTVWGDLEIEGAIKIPNESVDLAFLNNVLFQTKNHEIIFKEVTRILKKNSRLLVTEWEKFSTPFGPDPSQRIDKEEIKKQAERVGLTHEKDLKAGPYHYSLIFRKA